MHSQEPAFECLMCGQCCHGEGGIVISKRDQQRLCAFLQLRKDKFLAQYAQTDLQGKVVLRTDRNNYCIFFDQETGCRVHSHKPDICRAWPFFLGNLKDELSWKMAQDSCPGINPRISHAEFVRQGLIYLQENDLLTSRTQETANSLQLTQIIAKI